MMKLAGLRLFLFLTLLCLLMAAAAGWLGFPPGPLVLAALALLAIGFARQTHASRHFAFTLWVFTFSTAAFLYPAAFIEWGGYQLSVLIVPLIQVIMFGMGCSLSPSDFLRVFKMPWPVLVGMVLQFGVMPLAGLGVALLFGFDPAVAAGLVLVGACPGGVASNLMTYLARGNLALSVTMTALSTLVSPVATPWLMERLAGQFLVIPFWGMFLSILDMIIVPILAGLVAHQILYGKQAWLQRGSTLAAIAGLCAIGASLWFSLASGFASRGVAIGLLLIGFVAAIHGVLKFGLKKWPDWMERMLPLVSMGGICFILAIMLAKSREELLGAGVALLLAAILHNATGYLLGYGGARLARLEERDCRTVALEVGLQNGGMATALALNALKSLPATLGPIVFGIWMNLSGSMVAAYWHGKPPREDPGESHGVSARI